MAFLRSMLGFERLIGPALVKLVYVIGLGVIAAVAAFTVLSGAQGLAAGNLSQALTQFIAGPAVAAAAFIYWRFLCELLMLAFLAFERLGEVRDLLRESLSRRDHPQF